MKMTIILIHQQSHRVYMLDDRTGCNLVLKCYKTFGQSTRSCKNVVVYNIDYLSTILKFSNDIQPINNSTKNDDFHIIQQPQEKSSRYFCANQVMIDTIALYQ